jgi:putative DNA primase/helicase
VLNGEEVAAGPGKGTAAGENAEQHSAGVAKQEDADQITALISRLATVAATGGELALGGRVRESVRRIGGGFAVAKAGRHRAACPECAVTKARQGDTALWVLAEPDGRFVWQCHRCGWSGVGGNLPAGGGRTRSRPAPPRAAPPAVCTGALEAALALWRTTRPTGSDTPAAGYLTARGCALPHREGDLRYLPDHRHPGGWRGARLVALVTDAVTGEPMTLHRTWVQPDGNKAPVDKPRLLWPGLPKAGGVVRLWPDEAVAFGLCVAEGIETALTAAQGFGHAWACVDAGNLAVLPVLDGIEALTIVADHDVTNARTGIRPGSAAADQCAQRWLTAGVETRIWMAPSEGADMNDLARSA